MYVRPGPKSTKTTRFRTSVAPAFAEVLPECYERVELVGVEVEVEIGKSEYEERELGEILVDLPTPIPTTTRTTGQ